METLPPGVAGEGLLDRMSNRVAFLIGKVFGVAKTSSLICGFTGVVSSVFKVAEVTADGKFAVGFGKFEIGTGETLTGALVGKLARFSLGGGLERVGLGFILVLLDSWWRPPPIGLFRRVPRADSALNSHLIMVSFTVMNAKRYRQLERRSEYLSL